MPYYAVQSHGQQEVDKRRGACPGRATRGRNQVRPSRPACLVNCCILISKFSPSSLYTPGTHTSRDVDGIFDVSTKRQSSAEATIVDTYTPGIERQIRRVVSCSPIKMSLGTSSPSRQVAAQLRSVCVSGEHMQPCIMQISAIDGRNHSWPSLAAHFVDCCIRTANLSPASPYAPGIHTSHEIDGILGENRATESRDRPTRQAPGSSRRCIAHRSKRFPVLAVRRVKSHTVHASGIHTSGQVDGILDANNAIERRGRPTRHAHTNDGAAGAQEW
ncbi:uncharacterized protein LAESUDRAFT_765508 [Laetiporus sulphureus 93-53]|uniref:Uncharacterized protein n=1 Tax=Laetiporus sulphureus 93-53 TaxID=1314785 RepID=A0A165AQM0_9APHY|nr:uncharacterized protein LAESUDRAFT_765639 [Laetiporus sulphureus 93-53]XP_040757202.1 uncharacterized protein LAESUDRAFT_765508 [Laetiporus sulphureus 93-53]KZS99356.1 hypothetical protein LAESUDRAFT_765639 [Laetiporus sulphureus 93-53]KZS99461.1 hypothetical protein LAESUDRAFT_765508 [Laetiporus sulphureus 93-53]